MPLYLLDANVLIDADRDYYPMDRIPQFWYWLISEGKRGNIKIAIEVLEEIAEGRDRLATWAKDQNVIDALRLNEDADPARVDEIVRKGYAGDLSDEEVERIGKDPFIVSHAVADASSRVVVTTEHAAPSKKRANRRLPDVCKTMGVDSCDTFELIRRLNFKIT